MKIFALKPPTDSVRWRKSYCQIISVVALSGGLTAHAESGGLLATNLVMEDSPTNITDLGNVTVVAHVSHARTQVADGLGASAFTLDATQIATASQGGNAPLSDVILRAPGVARDSAANGGLHVRGEHANLQYRLNDVLLPEGLSGFGQELDPRFVSSMSLITGALPAQYGYRTAGVVDIHTKSGAYQNGGTAEMYGGSFDTVRPSFESGGSQGKLNYFVDGSFDRNGLGIENPTPGHDAIHDTTSQYKTFTYLSYVIDDTSRLSFMGSASVSDFQVPNTPGLTNFYAAPGLPGTFNSSRLNENQTEQNYFGVLAYQKSAGDLDLQIATFGRNSDVHFTPDRVGDLVLNNGVATDEQRDLLSGGLQADASYELGDKHTLRAGTMLQDEAVAADSATSAFLLDGSGNPVAATNIVNDAMLHALFAGVYLQDEWKILPQVTLNYGARFDDFNSSFDNEHQLSPRANLVYKPVEDTTLHAGYSRYFTPPPLEAVASSAITGFNGTSNQAATTNGIANVRAERANYYDAGISRKLARGLQVGLDSYYKTAVNQLDDGLFGQSLIPSAFNYAKGRIYGVELSASYDRGGFSTYANLAYSVAQGENWNSAQFLFNPGDLAYVRNHWVYLDHDQRLTGSFGTAYTWKEGDRAGTSVYMDALYGTGLRQDGGSQDGTPGGDPIPNGGSVPAYYSINVGAEQSFKLARHRVLKARLDVVNLTDNIYQLRSGSGIGVNAAQYGERLGFFGSVSYAF